MPPIRGRGAHLELALSVHPSDIIFNIVTKVEKWEHPCPMDTFLVHL